MIPDNYQRTGLFSEIFPVPKTRTKWEQFKSTLHVNNRYVNPGFTGPLITLWKCKIFPHFFCRRIITTEPLHIREEYSSSKRKCWYLGGIVGIFINGLIISWCLVTRHERCINNEAKRVAKFRKYQLDNRWKETHRYVNQQENILRNTFPAHNIPDAQTRVLNDYYIQKRQQIKQQMITNFKLALDRQIPDDILIRQLELDRGPAPDRLLIRQQQSRSPDQN